MTTAVSRGDRIELADVRSRLERRFAVVGALEAGDDGLEAFGDRVDSALRDVRGRHPSPLVLAGSEELLDAFRRRSRNLHRLAGVVTGPASETVGGLYVATRTVMEEYLLSREREAGDLLEEALRTRPESVAAGATACRRRWRNRLRRCSCWTRRPLSTALSRQSSSGEAGSPSRVPVCSTSSAGSPSWPGGEGRCRPSSSPT